MYFTDKLSLNTLSDENTILSDVALVSQKQSEIAGDVFNKGGFNLVPKFINYYPSAIEKLGFYVETYQKSEISKGLFKYFISDENNVVIEKYSNFKKTNNSNFDALYSEIDIKSLPSGNYYLYVELRDSSNTILDRKRMYFQRLNKTEIEKDNVDYYELNVIKNNFAKKYDLRNISHHLRAVKPVSDDFEKAAIDGAIKSGALDILQNYFYSFWSKRDSKNPEERWMEYAEKLKFVEQEFGNSMIEGHETSRGRVYLQYGKPLERIERNTSQYGFIEIWRYEQIDKQGNAEFLFIENQLYDDEFQLVHSSLNGEIFNREWSQILQSNNF
jgi:GWxTD domain-containing protein